MTFPSVDGSRWHTQEVPGERDGRRAGGLGDDFEALVAAEIPGLYRYARSVVGSRAEAQDVVGDTVVRALERRDQFRGEASVRTWLHRILYRLAVDRARHHGHEVTFSEAEDSWRDERYSVDAAAVAERAETRAELRDALVHLPFHYRTMVVLHDAEGWPVAEVARMLGIGLPAAKQRLRRGRMMLVTVLAKGEERRVANRGVPLSCWRARRQVSDYIDGELGPHERALLEAHLAGCATCPPLYQALAGVKESLGALHDPDSVVPPQLARRIQEQTRRR